MTTIPQLTQGDLYDLGTGLLPSHRVAALEDGAGEALYQAVAAMAARVEQRSVEHSEAGFILAATGARRATGTVTVTWAAGTTEAVSIRTGQIIARTPWGVTYRLAADLSVGAGAAPGAEVTVAVEAEWSGFEGNVGAGEVSEWALPSGVDPAAHILWGDGVTSTARDELLDGIAAGEVTLTGSAMTGGAIATLDLLAAERGLPRAEGEGDAALRARIRRLPDVLTPAAILRTVNAALRPYGVTATYSEPWQYGFAPGNANGAVNKAPPTRRWHFVVSVPPFGEGSRGFAPGNARDGAVNRASPGASITVQAATVAGLQQTVSRIRPAGIWGAVYPRSS